MRAGHPNPQTKKMEGSITVLLGAGILLFVFSYIMFKLGDNGSRKHILFQVLLFFLIFALAIIIGKAAIDESDYCIYDVVNSTEVLNSTTNTTATTFEYDRVCIDNENDTPLIFFNLTLWFFRLASLYLLVYFIYEVFVYLNWVTPKEKGKDEDDKRGDF